MTPPETPASPPRSATERAAEGDYDVVVIGGGLAGLTAGLFSARYGCSTLVVESLVPGGQLINVEKIEDFPGFPEGVAGFDLGPIVHEQAERSGVRFELAEVDGLEPAGRHWRVIAGEQRFDAGAVIVATGARPKALGVPGEAELYGRGVSHCASCDAPFFAGKVVGVAGGDDAALQEALTLAGHASQVIIFDEADSFSAQEIYRRRVAEQPRIEARHNVVVQAVLGDGAVGGVHVRDRLTGAESQVALAALFVYAGFEPNTGFLQGRLRLSTDGRLPADTWMQTELPGVFAAGAVRESSPGHAITAAADGATAAIAAHRYVGSLR